MTSTVSGLDALLSVQDMDTALTQLQHRRATLAERAEMTALAQGLAENERRATALRAERDDLSARQADLESQIQTTQQRRHGIEQRLYAARNTSARDLQAMDDEIRHLGQHQSELEEAELELMMEAEPVDAELTGLDQAATGIRTEAVSVRARLAEAERSIDAELTERAAAREDAAAAVPSELLSRYETLRSHLNGIGAARLTGNRCGGCHLELPSMEVERIRHLSPGAIVTCEQCGRILVPVSGAGTDPPR